MNTNYEMLAEKLAGCGMERKRVPFFVGLMQAADEAFPMSDEDKKWALARGFIPDKLDLYDLDEDSAHQWVSDFDYFMMHPLNNHFKFWVNDKLTLKYMLNTPPLMDLMPEYYIYIENDGRYTYLMDMPPDVKRDEGCLLSLLERKRVLAIKPNNGSCGAGFMKLEMSSDGSILANGSTVSEEGFLDLKQSLNGCIVTEYIRQHKDLRRVWGGSECALRIVMAKSAGGGVANSARLGIFACCRMRGSAPLKGTPRISSKGASAFPSISRRVCWGVKELSTSFMRAISSVSALIRIRASLSMGFSCLATKR